MTRLQLLIYADPGEIQIFCNLIRKDGGQEKLTATVDTGAEISLFPLELLDILQHRRATHSQIVVDQAGLANQSFTAIEAYVSLVLEDEFGNITHPFEILAWFAETNSPLIGFAGVLDRAVLHIDMPKREGWLEIDVP